MPALEIPIDSAVQRLPNGQFRPGSGGRRKGARNKVPRELMASIRALGPAAIEQLREALTRGERYAVELVLTYLLPKDRLIELEAAEADDIRQALQEGDLSVNEAAAAASALSKLNELLEIENFRERLEILERRLIDRAA